MNKNLILVTIDSLRGDHCGFLGGDGDLTPTLDDLASESVVYENAIAPGPRTPSSMPVVFTGEFVQEGNLGVYEDYDQKSSGWMDRQARIRRHVGRFQTLPQRLQALGYDTAGVTANPWTTQNTGFDAGFDVFEAVTERSDVTPESLPIAGRAAEALDADLDDWLLTWPDFYDLIVEAREQLSEPYFLWVFLLDPHQPYITPRRYREENSALGMYYANLRYNRSYGYTDDLPGRLHTRLERAYRDSIRSVDAFVDRLVGDFQADDPALVFHADHGEAFGDHGAYGHRLQLYRENLHVPLFVHNAGTSGRVTEPASLAKLPRTVADCADSTGAFDPESLTQPLVVSRTEEGERVSVRDDRWAYVEADPDFESYLHDYQPRELYDRASDPGEENNLVGDRPTAQAALADRLAQHRRHRSECATVAETVEALAPDL